MQGTVPIVMCDDESGCDEWFIDNYDMGVSNWRTFVPAGWQYDPHGKTPDLCPEHAPKPKAPTYATDHGFTPHTGPFANRPGEPERCRVMLARYPCPHTREEHDPDLPPVDVDVFGYRRGRFDAPEATEGGDDRG